MKVVVSFFLSCFSWYQKQKREYKFYNTLLYFQISIYISDEIIQTIMFFINGRTKGKN